MHFHVSSWTLSTCNVRLGRRAKFKMTHVGHLEPPHVSQPKALGSHDVSSYSSTLILRPSYRSALLRLHLILGNLCDAAVGLEMRAPAGPSLSQQHRAHPLLTNFHPTRYETSLCTSVTATLQLQTGITKRTHDQ